MELYKDKDKIYFQELRHDILSLVPNNKDNRILEVGAASGNLLVEIKKLGLASEVIGTDIFEIPDTNQQSIYIDQFIITNIENENLQLPVNHFDIIICGDVLEHLHDPWRTLQYLTKFLKTDGIFILSIPNFREIKTMIKVFILGDFRYESSGILDRTHLRFFCKKNIISLVKSAGLEITHISPSFQRHQALRFRKYINYATLGLLQPFIAHQYLVVAKK